MDSGQDNTVWMTLKLLTLLVLCASLAVLGDSTLLAVLGDSTLLAVLGDSICSLSAGMTGYCSEDNLHCSHFYLLLSNRMLQQIVCQFNSCFAWI